MVCALAATEISEASPHDFSLRLVLPVNEARRIVGQLGKDSNLQRLVSRWW